MIGGAIRELVTVFGFQTDEKGIKDYQSKVDGAIAHTKSVIGTIGTVLGTTFAIAGGAALLSSISSGVRSANKAKTQLGQILGPSMELEATWNKLFEISQAIGTNIEDTSKYFHDLALSSEAVGVGQETALAATKNIMAAMDVGRQSDEEMAATFQMINAAMKTGAMSAKQFGTILSTAPKVIETLGQNLGKSKEQLLEMVKAGKLTAAELVKGFSKVNKQLDKDLADKPNNMADAYQYVYNEVVRVGQAVWKLTKVSSKLADGIIYLTDVCISWGEEFIEWIGGAESAMRLLESAVIAAFGYTAARLILSFIGYIRTLSFTMATLQKITYRTLLPWLAIGAAIAVAVLAVEDFLVWMRGGKSLFGRWLGPFEEFSAKFKAFFSTAKEDVQSLNTIWDGVKQAWSGDLSGGLKTIMPELDKIDVQARKLMADLATFISDQAGKLFTLDNLKKLTEIGPIKQAIDDTISEFKKLDEFTFGALTATVNAIIALLNTAVNLIKTVTGSDQKEMNEAYVEASAKAAATGGAVPTREEFIKERRSKTENKGFQENLKDELSETPTARAAREAALAYAGGAASPPAPVVPGIAPVIAPSVATDTTKPPPAPIAIAPSPASAPLTIEEPTWWNRFVSSFNMGTGIVPFVPPGAVGPVAPAPISYDTTVPLATEANVTVTANLSEIQPMVDDAMRRATENMIGQVSRQLASAMPKIEAPAT